MKQIFVAILIGLFMLGLTNTSQSTELSQKVIERLDQTYQTHRAMTQLYRWYTFYETDEHNIDNQLDILTENIHVKATTGEGTGRT